LSDQRRPPGKAACSAAALTPGGDGAASVRAAGLYFSALATSQWAGGWILRRAHSAE